MKVRDQRQEQLKDYGELFRPKKLARTEHPVTSHKAAEQVYTFAEGHHRIIYDTLSAMKDGTPYEIAEVSKMEVAAVFRRLNELQKNNKATPTGEERPSPTGRLCRVWKAI